MQMPPDSPDMTAAVDHLHARYATLEERVLFEVDGLAKAGFSDKRWCAIARTKFEEAFMALHRALRDYPQNDPNQYGKIPYDQPLPREFAPPPDPEVRRQTAEKRQIPHNPGVEWGDYTPDGDLGEPK